MKCTLKNFEITDGYSDLQNKTTNETVPCRPSKNCSSHDILQNHLGRTLCIKY